MCPGWGRLGTTEGVTVPEDVYVLRGRYAPHDWLFTRCAAVVHHGGAGTVALRTAVITVLQTRQAFIHRLLYLCGAAAAQGTVPVGNGRRFSSVLSQCDAALLDDRTIFGTRHKARLSQWHAPQAQLALAWQQAAPR